MFNDWEPLYNDLIQDENIDRDETDERRDET